MILFTWWLPDGQLLGRRTVWKYPQLRIPFTVEDSWDGTHLKINMEAKNEGLEDDFLFQTGDFQVPC